MLLRFHKWLLAFHLLWIIIAMFKLTIIRVLIEWVSDLGVRCCYYLFIHLQKRNGCAAPALGDPNHSTRPNDGSHVKNNHIEIELYQIWSNHPCHILFIGSEDHAILETRLKRLLDGSSASLTIKDTYAMTIMSIMTSNR